MVPNIKKLAAAFNQVRAQNPLEYGDDLSTQLQEFLVASGTSHDLSEKEIDRLALSVGVPMDQLGEFKEELASWL